MTDNAEKFASDFKKILSDFRAKGWKTPSLYERFFELINSPDETYLFCKHFLTDFTKSATIFNDSLSYIDKEQFAELVVLALDILKRAQKNENAEAVIEYASLQFPELLHEYLDLIFELKPNEKAYYSDYPWRNLPPEKILPFKDRLLNPETSQSDKHKLFRCLLETRNIDAVKFAYQYAMETKLIEKESYLIYYIEAVGFTIVDGKIESYCPNKTYHLSFPKRYFSDDRPIHLNKEYHPTWRLKLAEHKYKFGGVIEKNENNPFIHIITFDQIPANIKVSGLERLTLGMHIRELNESGSIFYKHNSSGNPRKIGDLREIEMCSDLPIHETEVALSETPERWTFQNWGCSNSRENLFRLGGEPSWIQSAEVPVCPVCNEKMDFLMQLDTDLPDTEDGEVYFGSGGICYIFWCDKTKVSGYLMQCT